MVRKCSCKDIKCVCNVEGTAGLTFTGNGSERHPYVPEWLLWSLVAEDTAQANVTVTGSGTSGDPFVVTIATLGGSIQQTVYNNDDTWRKPSSGAVAQVVVIGGGGGGGAASDEDAEAGGSGGAGGAMSVAWFLVDDLPNSVDIEVGQGGKGGRPIAGETNAKGGGRSWFGEYLVADGGKGGTSQANPDQTQYPTVGGTPPDGGPGGAGAVRDGSSGVFAEDHDTYVSPTGGGMGEGNVVGDTWIGGGSIGPGQTWAGEGGVGDTNFLSPGPQGGEDGGEYGGGGGGGRAYNFSGTNQNTEGGDGGDGVVVVTVW